MKDFLKYTFATIVGIAVVCLIISVFSFFTLLGLSSLGTSAVQVQKNSVMVVDLEGSLVERSEDNPLSGLLGDATVQNGLDDMLTAIEYAKADDNITGIYLEGGIMLGATPAMLQELHDALEDFKSEGKFIVAYGDNFSQGAYYLCSVADSLLINPSGMIELSGLSSTTIYYKNLLKKVGVDVQVFKVGTYKSAVEPFLLDSMSEANREQTTVFTNEIWDELLADISKSRGIKKGNLNSMIDKAMMFLPAEYYVKQKIVDKLAYKDEVKGVISNMMQKGKKEYNEIGYADVAVAAAIAAPQPSDKQIAVYYATGEIVEDAVGSTLYSETQIVGSKVSADLKKLADDDDIKAVVLRVNSPGGSAYAAEQIWHQVKNIKAKKPIIVSMGGYAASGGYYISCAADWIVAEPTTLTGSIGIFGMFPDAGELLQDKLGLHFSTVKTNKYSDFGSLYRPMNEGESAVLQAYINRGYELFTKRCADGRNIAQDSIKVIGEGRVWTGRHAKSIGLVDQLGNLDDAIAVAKKKAGLKDCTVVAYPYKSTFMDQLIEQLGGGYVETRLESGLGEYGDLFRLLKSIHEKDRIQAAMPFYLKFNL